MKGYFIHMEGKFIHMDSKFNYMEGKFNYMDSKFYHMEGNCNYMEGKFYPTFGQLDPMVMIKIKLISVWSKSHTWARRKIRRVGTIGENGIRNNQSIG
jgi:hypothetical protein